MSFFHIQDSLQSKAQEFWPISYKTLT